MYIVSARPFSCKNDSSSPLFVSMLQRSLPTLSKMPADTYIASPILSHKTTCSFQVRVNKPSLKSFSHFKILPKIRGMVIYPGETRVSRFRDLEQKQTAGGIQQARQHLWVMGHGPFFRRCLSVSLHRPCLACRVSPALRYFI